MAEKFVLTAKLLKGCLRDAHDEERRVVVMNNQKTVFQTDIKHKGHEIPAEVIFQTDFKSTSTQDDCVRQPLHGSHMTSPQNHFVKKR